MRVTVEVGEFRILWEGAGFYGILKTQVDKADVFSDEANAYEKFLYTDSLDSLVYQLQQVTCG